MLCFESMAAGHSATKLKKNIINTECRLYLYELCVADKLATEHM